jgi:hypothetical protein
VRLLARVAALALCAAAPLAAQGVEVREAAEGQWLTSYVPFLAAAPNDGPSVEWRMRRWRMADYEDRVTADVAWSLRAGWAPGGSWFGMLRLDYPRLGPGWRLAAEARLQHDHQWGFYGIGETDDLDVGARGGTYWRTTRRRALAWGDVTRRLAGPLHASLGAYATAATFDDLPGASRFREEVGERLTQREASLRAAIVLDLRDREYDTRQGALLEAGWQGGISDETFGRLYGIARGWVTPFPTTTIAARVVAANLTGTPTLESRLTLPAWETPASVLGGEESFRAVPNGRFTGRGVLAANLELRQAVKDFGDWGEVGVLGFADGGRVFERDDFALTFDGWTLGGGGGVWVRALRNNIFVLTLGAAEGGTFLGFRTGWAF